jgi:hypothetical protein
MSKMDAAVIVMHDGRTVKFGRGEKIQKRILWNDKAEPYAVRYDGRNGKTLVAVIADFPRETQMHATAHGISQKEGDGYADVDTVEDCWNTLVEIHERLMSGPDGWKGERVGGDGSSMLLRAVCLAFPTRTEAEHRATLKACTKEEKALLRVQPDVARHIAAIETERAKAVDVPATLAKFATVAA